MSQIIIKTSGGDFGFDDVDQINEMFTDLYEGFDLLNNTILVLQGSYMVTKPTLAIGSTVTAVSNIAFSYTINGVQYAKAAVAAGTAPGNDVIPSGKYGAVAFNVNASGTITVQEAAANATGYDSAALAVAGIPVNPAGTARMGTVTVIKSDGTFTFGTTSLADANTTEVYTDGLTVFQALTA